MEGVVDGEGVAVKDASSGVVEGVIKGSLQKHLKTEWVKAKVVHRGEGVLKVSPPLKQSVTKIKNVAKIFSVPGDGGPLKKDMTFSSMLNYTKIFCF